MQSVAPSLKTFSLFSLATLHFSSATAEEGTKTETSELQVDIQAASAPITGRYYIQPEWYWSARRMQVRLVKQEGVHLEGCLEFTKKSSPSESGLGPTFDLADFEAGEEIIFEIKSFGPVGELKLRTDQDPDYFKIEKLEDGRIGYRFTCDDGLLSSSTRDNQEGLGSHNDLSFVVVWDPPL